VLLKSVRFGREAGGEALAKGWLDGAVDKTKSGPPQQLAKATQAALAGQFDAARQGAAAVLQKTPDDIDALVLSGEIELLAKTPDKAIEAFTKAISSHKSARTLFGLARAQMALGKESEAEATAKSVLEASAKHVGARVMLATIAGSAPSRQMEAIDLLKKVVDDPDVSKEASDAELVAAYTALGKLYLAGSHMSQAEEAYAQALKRDPQNLDALIGNGELFYRAGRYTEADTRFTSAMQADASNLDAKIGKAKSILSLEQAKAAKDLLKGIVAANPKDPRVHYWIGRAEESLGETKDAEDEYRKSIESAGKVETGVPAYVGLSHLLATEGKADEAAKKLTEAAEKFPNSADLSRARGDIAFQTGRFDEAKEQYELAHKIAPDDLDTTFKLAQTYRHLKAYAEAQELYNKIGAFDKDFPNLALEQGLYYQETGKMDEALKMYQAALAKAPNDVDLKLRIGSSQVIAGHPEQAIPTLKEVYREKPNSPEANHFLGRAMLLAGQSTADAERYLDAAADAEPKNPEYQLYAGMAALDAKDYKKADTDLKRALELDSTLADAYWQIGELEQDEGLTDDAIKDLNTALRMKPSRSEAWAELAICYESKQSYQYSEQSWQHAIAGDDTNAFWHYKLGRVYNRLNNPKGEIKELERAIELAHKGDTQNANVLLPALFEAAEAEKATDKKSALEHYKEYVHLAPADDPNKAAAQAAIQTLAPG